MEMRNETLFTGQLTSGNPPALKSAILSGLDENGIPKDFISQAANWVQEHPLETILGAIAIGGIGYTLYRQFTSQSESKTEEVLQKRIARARRKRLRERRKTFMEKAKELFCSENENGEQKLNLGKTVTAVSLTAMGALAGFVVSESSVPVTLLGAASLAIAGYGLNSPMVSLGAIGMAVGTLVRELVRKTVKGSGVGVNTTNPDSVKAASEEASSAKTTQKDQITSEKITREFDTQKESKEDFGELEEITKALKEEGKLELA